MELLTQEIYNLKIKPSDNDFIHSFSKLELSNLNLKPEKNILVGFLLFRTNFLPINNYDKKLYIATTTYLTDKKYKMIYPLSIDMDLVTEKDSMKPEKILKRKFEMTKTEIDKSQIFEVYNCNNVKIFGVNISKINKKQKTMKLTKVLHMYSDPYITQDVVSLYPQVISTNFNSLSKRFFFFYKNIKVNLKEKYILEQMN